ncbi:MAG TPA: NADH-quinone oxidoreductase subunit J [Thermoanaerobaculia bacterium]|jgi:NADH-quinone oxidoreductase subunit J|nr:NADH-quinone oxidoreductase subunit J [Thermoanaerobaculia bacterium]
METVVFGLFAALALVSALVVVTHKSPIYSTLALVLTLFSVAVLFVLLGAPFLGALQVLVYAGAIVVLFLFVIMLLNVQKEEMSHVGSSGQLWAALLAAVVFVGMLGLTFWRAGSPAVSPLTPESVSLKGLAAELFGTYLLPFEIVGLLLLVAVIGATVAARRPSELGPIREDEYVSGDEPRTDPLKSGPDPHRPSVAEPAYQSSQREAS